MIKEHLLTTFLCFSFVFSVAADDDYSLELLHGLPGVSFRAIVVRDTGTIVVGGTKSTLLRSSDHGENWKAVKAVDGTELDFRDVEAVREGEMVLMSAGTGELSRVFHSTDDGRRWKETQRNQHPKGFYDGISFWSDGRGLLIGDPIDGRLTLLKTADGGRTWQPTVAPEVMEGEYGFAASGTGIVCGSNGHCLIATGGLQSRVLSSTDYGRTWQAFETQVRQGNESSGLFSIALHANGKAVAVGGNYLAPDKAKGNYVFRTGPDAEWMTGTSALPHKACVRFLDEQRVLCAGRTGLALSEDGGQTWKQISSQSFYTFDVHAPTGTVFLAGADGRIARLRFASR